MPTIFNLLQKLVNLSQNLKSIPKTKLHFTWLQFKGWLPLYAMIMLDFYLNDQQSVKSCKVLRRNKTLFHSYTGRDMYILRIT